MLSAAFFIPAAFISSYKQISQQFLAEFVLFVSNNTHNCLS